VESVEGGGKGNERVVETDVVKVEESVEGSMVEGGKKGKGRGKVGVVTDGVANKEAGSHNTRTHLHTHKEGCYHCCY